VDNVMQVRKSLTNLITNNPGTSSGYDMGNFTFWAQICAETVCRIRHALRVVPSRFSCPRCGLWVGFDESAVHQRKEGRKLLFTLPSQKALRAMITFPYSNAKRNK